jgi:hypothetical protein
VSAKRICGQCRRREPEVSFATGNRYTCKPCGGQAYSTPDRKGKRRKNKSIWTVSGGLPTLGKRR